MPVAITSIRTSPAFGPSRSIVSTVSGLPASQATAARVFMCLLPDDFTLGLQPRASKNDGGFACLTVIHSVGLTMAHPMALNAHQESHCRSGTFRQRHSFQPPVCRDDPAPETSQGY